MSMVGDQTCDYYGWNGLFEGNASLSLAGPSAPLFFPPSGDSPPLGFEAVSPSGNTIIEGDPAAEEAGEIVATLSGSTAVVPSFGGDLCWASGLSNEDYAPTSDISSNGLYYVCHTYSNELYLVNSVSGQSSLIFSGDDNLFPLYVSNDGTELSGHRSSEFRSGLAARLKWCAMRPDCEVVRHSGSSSSLRR